MYPVLMALIAAILWGLWWIPIRYLETIGLEGASSGLSMNVGAFLAIALWVVLQRASVRVSSRAIVGAVLIGSGVACFAFALTLSDVVRVILLFYLAPAWSTLIEWRWMGRSWRWPATVAIVASLTGALMVLGGDVSTAPMNWGDLLAALAGISWAVGAALVFGGGQSNAAILTLVTSLAAVAVSVPFAWNVDLPTAGTLAQGVGIGAIFVLPILFATLWSAQRLAPAALSFLLTAEILSGVISSALLLDEPFGLLRGIGACLIVLGALAEVLPQLVPGRRRA